MGETKNKGVGYRQVADELRSRISSGRLKAGDPLPTEVSLAEEFSVARGTVRRAVEHLGSEGLVNAVHGRGWFVTAEGQPVVVPKHREVAEALRQRITAGRIRAGDVLPSEAGLCDEFDISRDTARKAFAELEKEGLVRSERGHVRTVSSSSTFHESEDQSTAWSVFSERPIYENYWVTVTMADIQTPDGERFEHHKVYLPPAAMTAMLDDQNRVFMMWRHRFVSDTWNWELPGGVVDDGESPAETAEREILEETGYRPTKPLEHVVSYEPMIGTVSSPHHVFVARGVEYVAEPTEKNESQRTAWIPLDEILQLITQGKVANSGALVALLHLLATK